MLAERFVNHLRCGSLTLCMSSSELRFKHVSTTLFLWCLSLHLQLSFSCVCAPPVYGEGVSYFQLFFFFFFFIIKFFGH